MARYSGALSDEEWDNQIIFPWKSLDKVFLGVARILLSKYPIEQLPHSLSD